MKRLDELVTPVDVIDYVSEKLLAQGVPSSIDGICMYRGGEGKKCGIGHMISDANYSPELEKTSVHKNFDVCEAVYRSCPNLNDRAKTSFFLNEIQRIHDGYRPTSWERQFSFIRSIYS